MTQESDLVSEFSYLDFLPSIYQQAGRDSEKQFIKGYLKVFQKILSGIDDGVDISKNGRKVEAEGIAETLDRIPDLFYPSNTPNDFLDWLASWMGLVLKEEWSEDKKRDIIARVIPLYRLRGTKMGLEEFVKIYVGSGVKILEDTGGITVGLYRVGESGRRIGGVRKYFFTVVATLLDINKPTEIKRRKERIKKVIDNEKPIHTRYELIVKTPMIQVGNRKRATVGENTLIGSI
jgi:phage tail-like protein